MKVVFATSNCNMSKGDGTSVYVRQGSHWPADDPLVLLNPGMFTDDPSHPSAGLQSSDPERDYTRSPNVESATREPGERRTVRRETAAS